MKTPNDYEYGGHVQRLAAGSIDFNLEAGRRAVVDLMEALSAQARVLRAVSYEELKPDALAKTASYTARTLDETARLLELLNGRADSRADVNVQGLLEILTSEELDALMSRFLQKQQAEQSPVVGSLH